MIRICNWRRSYYSDYQFSWLMNYIILLQQKFLLDYDITHHGKYTKTLITIIYLIFYNYILILARECNYSNESNMNYYKTL